MDTTTRQHLIDAFIHGRRDALDALAAALPETDPQRPTALALAGLVSWLAEGRRAEPRELRQRLDPALTAAESDPALLMCVLNVAYRCAANHPTEQQVIVRRAIALAPRVPQPRIAAIAWRMEHWQAIAIHDRPRALRALEAGLAIASDDADLHLEFTGKQLWQHLRLDDFDEVERLVAWLAPRVADCLRCGMIEVVDGLFGWWLAIDDLDAVEKLLADIAASAQAEAGEFDWARVDLLLRRRRLSDLEAFLARIEARARAQNDRTALVDILAWRAQLALARRRNDEARQLLESANRLQPRFERRRSELLDATLAVALACRDVTQAQATLAALDPQQQDQDHQMDRVRLRLLQGDEAGAVRAFARLLRMIGDRRSMLAPRLDLAFELEPATLARIWTRALQPADPEAVQTRRWTRPATTADDPVLIGSAPGMVRLRELIGVYAPLPQTVLILGETGTGKDIVARLLHAAGAHPRAPFLPLNCAAIPDSLAEAELFGHAQGAFTGADRDRAGILVEAGEGTVFLDEISSLSLRLQGLLLRVLESGDFRPVGGREQVRTRARFVVASNEPLEQAVAEGRFRADLFYRLNRFLLPLPPLRDRRDDIPELVAEFTRRCLGHAVPPSAALLRLLQAHDWPGNVRELRNEIERLAILNPGATELPGGDASWTGRSDRLRITSPRPDTGSASSSSSRLHAVGADLAHPVAAPGLHQRQVRAPGAGHQVRMAAHRERQRRELRRGAGREPRVHLRQPRQRQRIVGRAATVDAARGLVAAGGRLHDVADARLQRAVQCEVLGERMPEQATVGEKPRVLARAVVVHRAPAHAGGRRRVGGVVVARRVAAALKVGLAGADAIQHALDDRHVHRFAPVAGAH